MRNSSIQTTIMKNHYSHHTISAYNRHILVSDETRRINRYDLCDNYSGFFMEKFAEGMNTIVAVEDEKAMLVYPFEENELTDCFMELLLRFYEIERSHRSEQSGYTVSSNTMKSAENFLRAFRREVTLNVRNNQNQYTQQHHDFKIIDY